jgi:hypothetical protein
VSGLQVLHLLEDAGELLGPSGISPTDALVSDQREVLVPGESLLLPPTHSLIDQCWL